MKFFLLIISITYPLLALANPINDISFKSSDNLYNFYVEIPAGTKQKWEVNKKNGILEWEEKNSKKRIIDFISYPGNYGFIPQTLGGDNDPIDVIDLDESCSRGQIKKVKIIGGLYFKDKKEEDIKLIAVGENSTFKNIKDIEELFFDKPSVLEIIKQWFLSYKKPGKMVFYRYLSIAEAQQLLDESHQRWLEVNKN